MGPLILSFTPLREFANSGRSGRESTLWKPRISHLEIRIFMKSSRQDLRVGVGGDIFSEIVGNKNGTFRAQNEKSHDIYLIHIWYDTYLKHTVGQA